MGEAIARGCAIVMTAHEPLALGGVAAFSRYEIVRGRLIAVAATAREIAGPQRSAAAGG
jgi:hypothetical protein